MLVKVTHLEVMEALDGLLDIPTGTTRLSLVADESGVRYSCRVDAYRDADADPDAEELQHGA